MINYGREFENIVFDKTLLHEYLIQRGLFLNKDRDLIHLDYLSENFHSEIRKRGTNSMIRFSESNIIPDGEFLRLLDLNIKDEFIFCYPDHSRSSWTINRSSPSYKGLSFLTNCIKGYESTQDISDLQKYPLINPSYVALVLDGVYSTLLISGVPALTLSGIGGTSSATKPITIDSNLSYEITFLVKFIGASTITFGVRGFDEYGNQIDLLQANDVSVDNNFFFEKQTINQVLRYYYIRGIIYNYNQSEMGGDDSILNIGFGNSLILKQNIRSIEPVLVVDGVNVSGQVYIQDFKIRPLNTNFSRCFINSRNNIIMINKQKPLEYSTQKIDDLIRHYLLPYNCNLLKTSI